MKPRLRELLAGNQLEEVARLAEQRHRVLGDLVPLTYDRDALVGWRAVEAMGLAAGRVADRHPEVVRECLRRLHWLLSEESGGVCWRAPEAMAEILRRCPARFPEYVPIVTHLLLEMAEEDLSHFRAGILWAIGRLGRTAADLSGAPGTEPAHGRTDAVLAAVRLALDHEDPQVRGIAVWALTRLGRADLLTDRAELLHDGAKLELYENGDLRRATVAALARRALATG